MSKARNLSDFISDATIDSTEIADLSVTHAKLHTDMNLSSKTLTFAANQISGNSVDGGVISNFASTGIDDNASATAVTILSDGKVGIGTDSPAHRFHINQPGNSPQLRISGNANWDFYSYNDTNFYVNNASGTVLGLLGNRDAYFGKNLSIGDSVLSTYHANYPALDIGSSASVQGYTGNNGVWLQSNLFMNTNGQWTSKSDDYSAMLELYDGNFNFYNTASGTGTRTLLTPMTIRQNGNVGIGETSPVGKLSIKGTTASNEKSHVTFENTQGSKVFAIGGGKSGITNNGFSIVNITDNNAPLHITDSGNVGIGVTNPVEKLDIQGHQGISINNNYAHIGSTSSGAAAIFGHNIKSDPSANTIKSANTGYHSSMVKMYYNEGITFHSTSGTNTAGDTFYTQGGTTNELMRIANSGNVGIGNTNPSATLHVEDTVTGGGNSGHMKLGHTRTRTFYAGISSSENRWYKVLNYGTGNMFTGKVQIYLTREGGFNQTGAHKEYRASLGGYSNSVYGPLSLSGDGGEGGVASLEIGTDAGVYLRVNSSIYGGSVFVTFSGQGGMGWAYSNSSYSTSLP
jgi:hypothetical protein